jgi:hypothetical protein
MVCYAKIKRDGNIFCLSFMIVGCFAMVQWHQLIVMLESTF